MEPTPNPRFLPSPTAKVHPLVRFLEKVDHDELTGCWVWIGSRRSGRTSDHYGQFFPSRTKPANAHTWSFWLFRGVWPKGFELDHTCKNALCVNPLHLQPVTREENLDRLNHDKGEYQFEPWIVLNEEQFEWFEERAAIMEHDGGLPREQAERYAFAAALQY